MPIRLWHIPGILGLRDSLVPAGAARAAEEGREHPRNQTAVLAPSPADLAAAEKEIPTQTLSLALQTPPEAICMKLEPELWAQHLTSTPAAAMSQFPAGEGAEPEHWLPRSWSEGFRDIA